MLSLSCHTWDLVPWSDIEPRPPAKSWLMENEGSPWTRVILWCVCVYACVRGGLCILGCFFSIPYPYLLDDNSIPQTVAATMSPDFAKCSLGRYEIFFLPLRATALDSVSLPLDRKLQEGKNHFWFLPACRIRSGDFFGGPVVKILHASAGNTGLIPGPGRCHMPRGNQAHGPQLLSLHT